MIILILYVFLFAFKSFYHLRMWQIKEYRTDRYAAMLRTKPGRDFVFGKEFIFKLSLFVFALVFIDISFGDFGIFSYVVFLLLFLLSILYFFKKRKLAKMTPRMLLTAIVLIFITTGLGVFLYDKTLDIYPLVLVDLCIPLLAWIAVVLVSFPANAIKKSIYNKAKKKRESLKHLKVIGITGSFGKSTVKDFLATILEERFNVLKTEKNQNTEMGISKMVIDKLDENCEVLVVEMGAYKMGEIKTLCDITKPQIGVLTGINEQHLDTFGSIENTQKGKYELIESLPKDGASFFNADNQYSLSLAQKTKGNVFTYGAGIKSDFIYKNLKAEGDLISFDFCSQQGSSCVKVKVCGKHNASNIVAAISVALYMGLSMEEILAGLQKIEVPSNAIRVYQGINGSSIVEDSYNSNPDGVISALKYLNSVNKKHKVVVMPCLIELGKKSKQIHEDLGRRFSAVADDIIITTPDFLKSIMKGSGEYKSRIKFIPDAKSINSEIERIVDKNSAILIEGRVDNSVIEFCKKHE